MPRLLFALLVLASCKEVNPDFCKNAANANDPHCKVDAAGMKCTSRDMCTDQTMPVCDLMENGGTCVACTTTDPGACKDNTPMCSADHTCEACSNDAQCGGVCLPSGACAAPADIIYVSPTGDMGDGLTAAQPCSLVKGLMIAGGSPTRNVISMAQGSYVGMGAMGFVIAGSTTLDARNGADLTHTSNDGDVLTINSGAHLLLLGGRVHNAQNGDGIAGKQGSTTTIFDTLIDQNDHYGINCDRCTLDITHAKLANNSRMDDARQGLITNVASTLRVSRSTFVGNRGGAMSVASSFVIVNNFIFNNGDGGSLIGGIGIATTTSQGNQLDFNSIVHNTANVVAGVGCTTGGTFDARNNIIWNNNQTAVQVGGSCFYKYSDIGPTAVPTANDHGNNITDNPMVTDELADLHLQTTSTIKGKADPATALTGIMATDLDGDTRPLPTGQQADIGADEVP